MSLSSDVPLSRKARPSSLEWVLIAAVAALLFVTVFPVGPPIEHADTVLSMSNMRQIMLAASAYSYDNDGHWPDHLESLFGEYLNHPQRDRRFVLVNPRDGYWGYRLTPPNVSADKLEEPSTIPLLYEVKIDGTIDPHGIIGYADGHVAWSPDRVED
ncbi:MAG: hypothetical protein AAF916_12265 [Planctomycetota bacterium]